MDYKGITYIPPEGYISNTYTVQKGDSLYSIARKLNTTVDELKRLNNLTSNTLSIGQILKIPTQLVIEDEENIYVVKSGDTLYTIAQNYNTTVDTLKQLNNLTSNTLSIGQLLKIPSPISEITTYTVQKGDTLYSIANTFNTTVDTLKQLNNLTSNTLSIGQVLNLPTTQESEKPITTPTTITYTVQSGDSLYKIANKYNTTVDAIKSVNNLTNNLLSIGQVLTIPTTTIKEIPPTTDYFNYKVISGDSLYKIAKEYNTTIDEIKTLNNLTSNLLSIGQTLKIPTTNTTSKTYVVKSGDSLYSIAKEFNTTVDNLKQLNNLTSNMLSIGQILIIE